MPSITILAPNYYPESNAGSKRVTRLAEHLAVAGWEVEVYTMLPHHPQNRIYEGYEGLAGAARVEKGVRITRMRPWIVAKDNLVLRLVAETMATIKLMGKILFSGRRSDVYWASSPYMFLGPAGLFLARLRGRPFVWDVRDLTWLYPRAAGKRTFGLDRILEAFMRWTARKSSALTTATDGLYHYFQRRPALGMPVPNGVSKDVLEALDPAKLGPPPAKERPRAVYAGLFGYNHGIGTVVEAARLLSEVDFLFVGDGPDRPLVEQAARELPNVETRGYSPFEDLVRAYGSANVLVSHVRRSPIFEWTQPAKLWEYMASGRPVVHAGEGEVISILDEEGIALTVTPEDAEALAEAISRVVADPELATRLGSGGRRFVEAHRNTEKLMTEMEHLLRTVAEHRTER